MESGFFAFLLSPESSPRASEVSLSSSDKGVLGAGQGLGDGNGNVTGPGKYGKGSPFPLLRSVSDLKKILEKEQGLEHVSGRTATGAVTAPRVAGSSVGKGSGTVRPERYGGTEPSEEKPINKEKNAGNIPIPSVRGHRSGFGLGKGKIGRSRGCHKG